MRILINPAGPSVQCDQTTYNAGDTITVTIKNGRGGLQEWCGLWIASNPDSSFSYASNWQYLNGTQTAPTAPPSYPVVLSFTAPDLEEDFDLRLFQENGVANRLARSAGFHITASAPSFTPDYYASPTGAGSHSGLSQSNAMQISEFWAVATAGKKLGLMDGTYTGTNSMITPTSGLNGSSGNPITVKALNDGMVLIDGQNARTPVRLNGNSWFVFEGFNCKRGADIASGGADMYVVYLSGNANSNIFRRVIAWDAYDNPTYNNVTAVDGTDPVVWGVSSSSNNVFEDCAGFGRGRYVFYTIANTDSALNNKCRRCWFRYDEAISEYSKPRATVLPDYTGNETTLMESCILEFRASAANVVPGDAPYICLEGAYYNNPDPTNTTGKLTIRGCLFFVGAQAQSFLDANAHGIVLGANSKHTDIEELTVVVDPVNANYGRGILAVTPNATYDGKLDKVITIGVVGDSIASGWSATNYNHYSAAGSCPDPYAYLTYRWVGGTKTGDLLWPWPMRQRIIDATGATSWPEADVHADVTAVLGSMARIGTVKKT